MKKNWLKVTALVIACAFALSTQAFAKDQVRDKDQKKDGSCLLEDCLY